MGCVMIACPVTGHHVAIGVETDQWSLNSTPPFTARIACPACGREHRWSKHDAWICEAGRFEKPRAA